MKKILSFFEIPAADFSRAVNFYQTVFGIKMETFDCETEKMAFFPKEDGLYPGSISWASNFDFPPSKNGVLISLACNNMEDALKVITKNGGQLVTPKTKIEADDRGYFAVFIDCEGNRIGLYSDK